VPVEKGEGKRLPPHDEGGGEFSETGHKKEPNGGGGAEGRKDPFSPVEERNGLEKFEREMEKVIYLGRNRGPRSWALN